MNRPPFSPEEFVRLLSLPSDHPDRVRAESSGALDAWRSMHREFETPALAGASARELAEADVVLGRRLDEVLLANGARGGGRATRMASALDDHQGVRTRIAAWLQAPSLRPAFALAALAVILSAGWWATRPHAPAAVRGAGGTAGIVVSIAPASAGVVEISWTPVAGADAYRVRLFGAELNEIWRRDGILEPRLRLAADARPVGLAAGTEVLVDVIALRAGDAIAYSRAKALRLP